MWRLKGATRSPKPVASVSVIATSLIPLKWPKREELIALNLMILHEAYFDSLGGAGAPHGALADAISRDFGSFYRWHAEFAAFGKAEGGPGWVNLPIRRATGG